MQKNTNHSIKVKKNFTIVSNHALDQLSPQAYYIYAMIQRYADLEYIKKDDGTIEEFVLNKGYIQYKCKNYFGEDAFSKYWREILYGGFMKMYQTPDLENRGKFIYEYEMLDEPNIQTPYLVRYNKDGAVSSVENIPPKKEVVKTPKTKNTETRKRLKTLAKQGVEDNQTMGGVLPGVVVAQGGQDGGYINTSFNNTSLTNKSVVVVTSDVVYQTMRDYSQKKLSPTTIKLLDDYMKKLSPEIVALCIQQSEEQGGKTLKYVWTILDAWIKKGLTTEEAITADNAKHELSKEKKREAKKAAIENSGKQQVKKSSFNNMQSNNHNWDLQELEDLAAAYAESLIEPRDTVEQETLQTDAFGRKQFELDDDMF